LLRAKSCLDMRARYISSGAQSDPSGPATSRIEGAVGVRRVTSSSADVGCKAMLASESAYLEPIFMAMAKS
jgi:hypothetical protein